MAEVPADPGENRLDAADLLQLHDLMARYAHLIDERAYDRLGEGFAVDVVYDATVFGGKIWPGLTPVIGWMRDSLEPPVAHHSMNIVVGAPDERGDVAILSRGVGVLRSGRSGSATYQDIARRTGTG